MGMLGLRTVGAQFSLFRGLQRLLFYFFLLLQVAAQEEADNDRSHNEGSKIIHKISAVFLLKLGPARPAGKRGFVNWPGDGPAAGHLEPAHPSDSRHR